MSGLILLRPMWLWALLPLAGFVWLLLRRDGALDAWRTVADPGLMATLEEIGAVDRGARKTRLWFGVAAAVALVLCLSGPAVERRDHTTFRNLDAVIFVVDLSDSMTDRDEWPGMQALARFGLAQLATRPAGLVVFAGDAYVATDLTGDHVQLGQTLSVLEQGMVPDRGSRPARGLALAAQMLSQGRVLTGDVVLFTDGEGLSDGARQEVARIVRQGARVSVAAPSGDVPIVALSDLANQGGGQLFRLGETDKLVSWLTDAARTRLELQHYPLIYWRDFGRFGLILALIPLLVWFRRRGV